MIPRTIHYCWFGRNPLDQTALHCIESWKKYFPEYEIVQWNEDNFDVSVMPFVEMAYRDKKWAFVSDVARLMIIYNQGGIYFDTDVEVIKSYEDIIEPNVKGFLGFENDGHVNSGIGFGAIKGHPFLKELIDLYNRIDYMQYKDHLSEIACPILTTELLEKEGLSKSGKRQQVADFEIFPAEYFAPMDYGTGEVRYSSRTHSVHWYSASWQEENEKQEQERMRTLKRRFGVKWGERLYGISSCVCKEGIWPYLAKRVQKYLLRRKDE